MMIINGYGSWGNCVFDGKTRLYDKLNPLYNYELNTSHCSYTFFDDGNTLYSRNLQSIGDVIYPYKPTDALIEYQGPTYSERAKTFATEMFPDVQPAKKQKIRGWCSWNTYFNFLNFDNLTKQLENAIEIQKGYDPDFKYILIDHGYGRVGSIMHLENNWILNFCEKVAENGLIPGIWVNPFAYSTSLNYNYSAAKISDWRKRLVTKSTIPNRNHPDNLNIVSYKDESYFEDIITALQDFYNHGVRLFKFDFNIFFFWQDGDRTEILDSYRKVYQELRKVLPEAIFIGCGVPLFESIGIFDFCRTTKDTRIAPLFPKLMAERIQRSRDLDIQQSVHVRRPFDGVLWNADYDQIDTVDGFINAQSSPLYKDGVQLAGFDLEVLLNAIRTNPI